MDLLNMTPKYQACHAWWTSGFRGLHHVCSSSVSEAVRVVVILFGGSPILLCVQHSCSLCTECQASVSSFLVRGCPLASPFKPLDTTEMQAWKFWCGVAGRDQPGRPEAPVDLRAKAGSFVLAFYWIMANNVAIVSGGQQSVSAIHTHVSILPPTLLPSRLPHNIQQSSTGYSITYPFTRKD